MDFQVRDKRNGRWHWVYDALIADPHVQSSAKVVYSALSTYSNCLDIHPSLENLSERTGGISEREIRYSLRELESLGYIALERSVGRGNANTYTLLKAEKGCNKCPLYIKGAMVALKGAISAEERGNGCPPTRKGTLKEHENIQASPDSKELEYNDYEDSADQAKRRRIEARNAGRLPRELIDQCLKVYIEESQGCGYEVMIPEPAKFTACLHRFFRAVKAKDDDRPEKWKDHLETLFRTRTSPFYKQEKSISITAVTSESSINFSLNN